LKNFDYPVGINFIALVAVCFGAGFLTGMSAWGALIVGTVVSLISSYVFFFCTVKLKEWEENKKINRIILPQLIDIVERFEYAIDFCILESLPEKLESETAENIEILKVKKYLDRRGALNKEIDLSRGFIQFTKCLYKPKTYRELLVIYTTIPIIETLNNLQPYYYLMDKDILEVLTGLKRCHYFRVTGGNLMDCNSVFFIQPHFIECWQLIRKLKSQYCKLAT